MLKRMKRNWITVCGKESNVAPPCWEIVCQSLIKLNKHLPYDSAIAL